MEGSLQSLLYHLREFTSLSLRAWTISLISTYKEQSIHHKAGHGVLCLLFYLSLHIYVAYFLILKGRVSGSNENSEHILNT